MRFVFCQKLTGDVDVLEQAADIAPTVDAGLAIERLRKMYETLKTERRGEVYYL